MTTPHDTFREQLLDLAYGELGRGEARALRAHLETCAECRAELGRMNATRSAMSGLGAAPAPERGENVLLAAAREAARARVRKPLLPSWAWGASIGAVAAAAVLVLTLKLAPSLRSPTGEPAADALVGSAPAQAPELPAAPAAPGPEPSSPLVAGNEDRAAGDVAHAKEEAKPKRRAFAKKPEPAPEESAEGPAGVARGASAKSEALAADEADRFADREPAPPPPAAAPAPSAQPERRADAEGASGVRREPSARAAEAPAAAGLLESAESAEAPAEPALRAKQAAPSAPSKAKAAPLSRAAEDPIALHARLALAGELRTATRTFGDCPGETSRVVESDAAGHVLKVTRRGAAAGNPFLLEQWYGEDGALTAVRWSSEGRVQEVRVGPGRAHGPAVPAFALEPRSATDAGIDAPPRCGG
jgi:hypothetical protein